jgi:hypothetical protein
VKEKNFYYLQVLLIIALIITGSCTKKGSDTSGLYTPTNADVTATSTLQELQQGRVLYIDNCNACHQLVSPDDYTPTEWRSIMNNMSPRTNMSSSEVQLVSKYVTRGK